MTTMQCTNVFDIKVLYKQSLLVSVRPYACFDKELVLEDKIGRKVPELHNLFTNYRTQPHTHTENDS